MNGTAAGVAKRRVSQIASSMTTRGGASSCDSSTAAISRISRSARPMRSWRQCSLARAMISSSSCCRAIAPLGEHQRAVELGGTGAHQVGHARDDFVERRPPLRLPGVEELERARATAGLRPEHRDPPVAR